MLSGNGYGKNLFLTGFSKEKKRPGKRYQDYVLLSQVPSMNDEDSEATIALAEYAKNTINLLSHRSKKNLTYPYPLVPAIISSDNENYKSMFSGLTLDRCASIILSEMQYRITFHIVGHGTPNSIGGLDFSKQISPETYARELQTLFTVYELENLKNKSCAFVFHTCNSAYVPVEKEMKEEEIFSRIQRNSFIGRFYEAMCQWGMQDFTVTGYRGYYACVLSDRAGSARIQNSFYNPRYTKDALHGEYTLSKEGCVPGRSVTYEDLFFPVTVYENPLLQQPLRQSINRMHP